MEKLDDVVPDNVRVAFIKIKCRGAELQVLRGSVEKIKRSRPVIVFEHGLGAADCYGTTPESVFDLLVGECGLKCFTMVDWLKSNGTTALTVEGLPMSL